MNFIYFSTLAWDEAGGAHNPTQITRALARRGHFVVFVEPQPSGTRETERLPIEVVALTELGMTPMELRRAWFGLPTGELSHLAQNLLARFRRNEPGAAIFSAPFDPFVRMIPVLRAIDLAIVYYAMDDFSAAPALGYTQFVSGAEEYLARESDVLIGVTPHVATSLERFGKQAHIIPNGIDIVALNPNAARAPNVARGELTLGFWGTIMDSLFDAGLIEHVARARPRWNLHLLGAVDPEPHRPSIAARLKNFPNVFFHGVVPHQELPRYAAAFDVCLAPFPDNDFTRGRDPIKVYEYLAAHVPVVASYAPHLRNMPAVYVAESPDEFVNAIQEAMLTRVDIRAIDQFLAQQSWDTRAEMLLNVLRDAKKPVPEGDATVLPSFAQPDANTVMRYVTMLEQELEQVQTWARELETIAQTRTSGLDRMKRLVPTWGKRG
jgi:glycosyltransferase involved in cell wall biosynthesis